MSSQVFAFFAALRSDGLKANAAHAINELTKIVGKYLRKLFVSLMVEGVS